MRRFDKHIPILSGLGDWARLRLILGGSNEYPPATVSSYTVVVSHLAFGTLSLRSINAPRWRRSWNVWISCSQDGPQGSQHLIRFSVGHFALAQGNPWGISYETLAPENIVTRGVRPESPSPVRAPRSSIFRPPRRVVRKVSLTIY